MVRSLAPACPWVSTCVVHLSTYCLPSGWHNVGPQHSVLETIFRLEDCHPPPWAELTDPVSLQEPSGLLTKHPVVSVCWGRKGIGEGHFLLLPCVGGGGGERWHQPPQQPPWDSPPQSYLRESATEPDFITQQRRSRGPQGPVSLP